MKTIKIKDSQFFKSPEIFNNVNVIINNVPYKPYLVNLGCCNSGKCQFFLRRLIKIKGRLMDVRSKDNLFNINGGYIEYRYSSKCNLSGKIKVKIY